jgi:acetyl-CoA carboxylase beta subunit
LQNNWRLLYSRHKVQDMLTGRDKGREALMYIVEFIFFGGARLFQETFTSLSEVEKFLREFDELEQKLIYINIIRKSAL